MRSAVAEFSARAIAGTINIVAKKTIRAMPINLNQRFNIDTTRLAFFGQDEWSLNKQFSLYLGARIETIKTTSEGDSIFGSSNTSRVLSPILQTLYKLPNSPNTQLRFAFARTYKAPLVGNLNARQVLSTNNSATRPDTQGKSEISVTDFHSRSTRARFAV